MNERTYQIRINAGSRPLVSVDRFSVAENCLTFLFGESGIGKSMLTKAVYGLLEPDEVTVEVNGLPYIHHVRDAWTKSVRDSSFFVFQEPSSHLNALMRIEEQLTEGSLGRSEHLQEILQRLWKGADEKALERVLNTFPKPYRPSGGEKQRILLAMAFVKLELLVTSRPPDAPTFFVFDEPTGSLDDNYRNLFLRLLMQVFEHRPFTGVVVTHDYSIISEILRKYQHLMAGVRFRELARAAEGKVELHDFSASQYLSWLQTVARSGRTAGSPDVVLDFGTDATVFGRRLRICKDAARTQPADLVIRKGEMVYLKAPSGMGKTTIAKVIMGLYRADSFAMTLCGRKFTEKTGADTWTREVWGRRAGMVFQHADEALNLQARVKETFAGLPLKEKLTAEGLKAHLSRLFEGHIVDAFLNKKVAYLSGGQKQRLNVLRTLVLDTDLIILDEPLNGLDFRSITKVLAILEEKRTQGAALLMISHNEEIFDTLVGREHVLYLGEG